MGGISDMNMSGFDASEAKYDRLNKTQSPEFAPGQGGDDDDIFGDIFNSSFDNAGGNMQSGGGDFGFNQPMGGNPFGSPFGVGTFGQQPQQNQTPEKSSEDKFFDALGKACKGIWEYTKGIGNSFSGLNSLFYCKWGYKVVMSSMAVIVIGVIGRIIGWKSGISFALGGCLSGAVGGFTWLFTLDSAKTCTSKYKDAPQEPSTPQTDMPTGFNSEPTFDFGDNNSSGDDDFDFDDDDFDFDDDEDDDLFSFNDASPVVPVTPEPQVMTVDEALESFVPIDKGMYTRQYLYDTFIKVLRHTETDFTKTTSYPESSNEFNFFYKLLQDAAEVTGLKEEELPDLISLDETLFTIRMTITRTAKLKPDLIAEELAKAYAYNVYEDDEEKRNGVFAKADTVLKNCIITIFTGKSHMISLLDMYSECKDFVLNNKNLIPVVLGVNEKGKVITADFKKIESIIVAGMPRSGKTWLVQAIITQMCALLSPKDINFYILDPKAGTSDYMRFYLPHVKVFASKYRDANGNTVNKEYADILGTLRHIVNVEAPRRKKLISEGGCVNINDYRDKHPDVVLPYIIIIIDEMVTLSSMEKEECKEYMTYLDNIVTQFPNLGIRGMFIPHEVKNQIISKTAYDSVKARISVKGSPEHIESSTGTKPRSFPYRLVNTGDMAVNIDIISASTIFLHGVVLSDSNAYNMEIFDYLRRIWSKLEPDEVIGSHAAAVSETSSNITNKNQPLQIGKLGSSGSDDSIDGLSIDDLDDDFDLFS